MTITGEELLKKRLFSSPFFFLEYYTKIINKLLSICSKNVTSVSVLVLILDFQLVLAHKPIGKNDR